MSPIKEKFFSIMQKMIVIFLALLMLITMMPVGIFPWSDAPSPEGDFVRRLPSAEVSSKAAGEDVQTRRIGEYNSVYYKFDISDLLNIKEDEIKEVTLRLSFLKGSGMLNNIINIHTLSPDRMPSQPENTGSYSIGKSAFARLYPYTMGADDSLCEIDMTDYAKNALANGQSEIAVSISADMPICVLMASQAYPDEAYRPCLKTVTGIAKDKDADTLKKAELKEAVYVSGRERDTSGRVLTDRSGGLRVGGENETYLKFDINKDAILGELYSARLLLNKKSGDDETKIKIYLVNNSEWTADNIKYSERPKGEEEEVIPIARVSSGIVTADITQKVCEAVEKGIYTLTFRIVGGDEPISFEGWGDVKTEPKLYLKATDRQDIVCAAEAALNALGGNRASFVTMDLLSSYSAHERGTARITWSECDEEGTPLKQPKYIAKNGEITRPKWFEKSAGVMVSAKIQAGDYITNRGYVLTIPAETAPDYSKYKFGNYIDIGNGQSESEQKYEAVNIEGTRRRWVNGSLFDYRVPGEEGVMVLNLACSPYEKNYLTFKLWEEDVVSSCQVSVAPCGYEGDEIKLVIPDSTQGGEEGFIYATYALPQEFTSGKSSVSLCARFTYPNDTPRGFYAAYMTQNPFFEPKQFAKQGEKAVSGSSFAEGEIGKFIDKLRLFFDGVSTQEAPETTEITDVLTIDNETNSVIFSGENINIAFNGNFEKNTASIYQRTEYYERYCIDCPTWEQDGALIIDYGSYKLIWNRNDHKEIDVSALNIEFSGVYREFSEDEYYTFSEDWQMTDDSVIPADKAALDGNGLKVLPGDAILLRHMSDPMLDADWRVSMINGRNISEISFPETERIDLVTIKAVGGISDQAESVSVICAIYEDEKLVGIKEAETDVYRDIDTYSLDFSNDSLYMKSSRTIRVFVSDNTEKANELSPKLELPQVNR